MTQIEKVYDHLKTHGSITPKEAYDRYGIMRLASRISDLRLRGCKITTVMETSKHSTYARYVMEGKDENKRI